MCPMRWAWCDEFGALSRRRVGCGEAEALIVRQAQRVKPWHRQQGETNEACAERLR